MPGFLTAFFHCPAILVFTSYSYLYYHKFILLASFFALFISFVYFRKCELFLQLFSLLFSAEICFLSSVLFLRPVVRYE